MSAALWTAVTNRYSALTLRLYTNADLPGASSTDTSKGTTVADDAEAWFARKVGLTLDTADADHLAVGTLATYVLLREYAGKNDDSVKADRERADADMEGLRLRTTAAKPSPRTSIQVDETVQETTEKPDFDRERWRGIIPNSPPAGES